MDIPAGTLERILREDGIVVPDGASAERMVSCWLPGHDDKKASMAVNVTKGAWFCHVCQIGGNEVQYLMTQRGMERNEAKELVTGISGSSTYAEARSKQARQWENKNKARPYWVETIPEIERGNRAIADHLYHLADGTLACHVRRYSTKKASDPKC